MLRHPHGISRGGGYSTASYEQKWPYRNSVKVVRRKFHKKCLQIATVMFVLMVGLSGWLWRKSYPIDEANMKETVFFWGPRGLTLSPRFKQAQTDPHRTVDLFTFAGEEWEDFMDFILRNDHKRPFVVVASGFDFTVPEELFEEEEWGTPRLPTQCKAWFSTNVDVYKYPRLADRIKMIPIGVDYDAKSRRMYHAFVQGFGWRSLLKPSTLVEFPTAPHDQERQLLSIIASSRKTEDRLLKVYGDFWVNQGYSRNFPLHGKGEDQLTLNRKEVYDIVKDNPNVVLSSYRLSRLEAWRAKSQYMFELSIPGNGMDCYRTWEALALGLIVITISTPLDPLFADLPVIILEDLADITEHNLSKWRDRFAGSFANRTMRHKLTNEYWVNVVLDEVKKHETVV